MKASGLSEAGVSEVSRNNVKKEAKKWGRSTLLDRDAAVTAVASELLPLAPFLRHRRLINRQSVPED